MKRLLLTLTTAMQLAASFAMADSQSAQMDITANQLPTVVISTTPINFGDIATDAVHDATGSITVRASMSLPYSIAIDGGFNAQASGYCRRMVGATANARRSYVLTQDNAFGSTWGDADFDNSCPGTYSNGGVSKAGVGNGYDQVHVVNARVFANPGLEPGQLSDTLTVTVYY